MSAISLAVVRYTAPVRYAAMLQTQQARRDMVERGEAPDTLYLLEHTPVITKGRAAHDAHVLLSPAQALAAGVDISTTDRGGDVTFHGPGQLVAYPILNLRRWRCSVSWYLRFLEGVLIETLAHYNIEGRRIEGLTGIWVRDAKIAAIGIGVHQWVTFHGVSLNVTNDLAGFRYIVPCGIRDKGVTSMRETLREVPPLQSVANEFVRCFAARLAQDFSVTLTLANETRLEPVSDSPAAAPPARS